MRTVDTYLERWAEREPVSLTSFTDKYGFAVVVPVCGEDLLIDDCLRALAAAAPDERVLAILVLNDGRHSRDGHLESNRETIIRYRAGASRLLGSDCWMQNVFSDRLDVVAHCAGSLTGGVGEARKVGCDIALRLWRRGQIRSPWLSTTDADARVDADYFAIASLSPSTGLGKETVGLWHDYRHLTAPLDTSPLALYESFLRYHELGLRYSGSPYAYPALGSTMVIEASAYASVRGFPKREAGEDFYMLDKLAKLGQLSRTTGMISLVDRPSDRVPFGTGASTVAIEAKIKAEESYLWYAPESYSLLQAWLRALARVPFHRDAEVWFQEIAWDLRLTRLAEKTQWKNKITTALRSRKEPQALLRHLHTDFDGLRTLQFFHWMRDDAGVASVPWTEAFTRAPFTNGVVSPGEAPTGFLHAAVRGAWDEPLRSQAPPQGAVADSSGPALEGSLRLASESLI